MSRQDDTRMSEESDLSSVPPSPVLDASGIHYNSDSRVPDLSSVGMTPTDLHSGHDSTDSELSPPPSSPIMSPETIDRSGDFLGSDTGSELSSVPPSPVLAATETVYSVTHYLASASAAPAPSIESVDHNRDATNSSSGSDSDSPLSSATLSSGSYATQSGRASYSVRRYLSAASPTPIPTIESVDHSLGTTDPYSHSDSDSLFSLRTPSLISDTSDMSYEPEPTTPGSATPERATYSLPAPHMPILDLPTRNLSADSGSPLLDSRPTTPSHHSTDSDSDSNLSSLPSSLIFRTRIMAETTTRRRSDSSGSDLSDAPLTPLLDAMELEGTHRAQHESTLREVKRVRAALLHGSPDEFFDAMEYATVQPWTTQTSAVRERLYDPADDTLLSITDVKRGIRCLCALKKDHGLKQTMCALNFFNHVAHCMSSRSLPVKSLPPAQPDSNWGRLGSAGNLQVFSFVYNRLCSEIEEYNEGTMTRHELKAIVDKLVGYEEGLVAAFHKILFPELFP